MTATLTGSSSYHKSSVYSTQRNPFSLSQSDDDSKPNFKELKCIILVIYIDVVEQMAEPIPVSSQKHDPAWKHVQMFMSFDKVHLKCNYCGKLFRGGGIHRIKEHLAGQKGNASTCYKTPPDVKLIMQQSLAGVVVKKRKREKIEEEIKNVDPCSSEFDTYVGNQSIEIGQVPDIAIPCLSLNQEDVTGKKNADRRKRARARKSDVVAVHNRCTEFGIRENNQVHMAIGRFCYDVGLPLDALNSVYFKPMVDAVASQGSEFVAPSYHDLRGWILKHSVDEVKSDNDRFMGTWGRSGCSLLVDQWNTDKGKTLVNFLVYCSEGTMFLKSVDVTEILDSTDAVCELLSSVVEEVGPTNVLQIITNGEDHYLTAAKRLEDVFPNIYWSKCATHCVNLMLDEFGKLEWIREIVEQAKSITRFVYNHAIVLNMVRKYTFGNDIVLLGTTRFDTNFLSLKRMYDLKHNLQSMVTSQEWIDSLYSKRPGGLEMLEVISNQSFWSSCNLIVHLTEPLLRVLRIASSKKGPGMGFVYAGIYRAIETVKKELVKKDEYMIYWNLIDHWWEQWQHPLHAAGFYLNPKFFYSMEGDIPNEIVSGMFDCIERLVPDIKVQDKIIKEINSYKNAAGDFGRKMAIRARDTLLPYEWWSTYGGGCPNLARLAVHILSQTCSSIVCKRDRISFEQLHNTRNCLEQQRLTDLVFVQYNLRLRQMTQHGKEHDSLDPISFERTNAVEEWFTEKEVCTEDYGNLEWVALDPPSDNNVLQGPSNGDFEELGATGFDDYEIFNRVKYGKE